MSEWMGWTATALFASSYFCKDARKLRYLQALASSIWIAYGVALGALPLVVANVIVASLALYSARAAAPEVGTAGETT